jgi:hypothetical protein
MILFFLLKLKQIKFYKPPQHLKNIVFHNKKNIMDLHNSSQGKKRRKKINYMFILHRPPQYLKNKKY